MDEHLLEVYLINTARHTEETPVAEWVSLPTNADTMKAVFERLGVDGSDTEQYQVSAYHSSLDGWSEALKPGESLDDLNYLAALLTQRSGEERDKFAAAVQYGDHAASAADLINLTHNLDCYWLYPTVHNSDDYGHYLIDDLDELELPDAAKRFFDYKSYGREAVKEDRGIFTDYGYIYNNGNDYAEWYKANQVPQEYRLTSQPSSQRDMDELPQGAALPSEPIPVRPLVLNATDTQGRIREITEHLEQGVQEVFESERYRDYLKAMSRFHNYSLNNTLLIVMQETAYTALKERELQDNTIAAEKGLKPYTLLNVEFNDGADQQSSGYIGWYYATLAVDGKICTHLETGLNHDIASGSVSPTPTRENYYAAGALKESDVDYVFNNVGFSSASDLYSLHLSDAARGRAELELAKKLIDDYCREEFHSGADFSDLSAVGIGHTTVTDDEIPIQAYANLADFRIEKYLGDVLIESRQYESLAALIQGELNDLEFGDLTYASDEQIAMFHAQEEVSGKEATSLNPAVQPVVTILWSESDKLQEGEQLPLARADALFKVLDDEKRSEREKPGYTGGWYDKTKFRIDCTFHGERDSYEGRQDFGDGDGALIDHIQAYHEYYAKDENWKNFVLHNEGAEAWEKDKAEREMLLTEFVPYMRLHCNLSEQERTAADMLENGEALTPEQTAYFHAVLAHVDACREKLNAGDYHLPDPPQLSDFDKELQDYKAHVESEIAQEAEATGMTVEEYAANGYEPQEQPTDVQEQPEETPPADTAPEQTAVRYYTINEGAARRANDANSYRDYAAGSATAEYRQMVDQAAAIAQRQKERVDPMYHEKIDALLDTYARKLAENLNDHYAIEARVPSILVAGGSNFPVRKKEKQNAARDRNMQEWQDVQGILDKIRSTGMGGISMDDPQAAAKLEAKLVKLESAQETMKAVNAYFRKNKTLEGCPSLTPEQITKLQQEMAQSWHLDKSRPYPAYMLSNNNAEIRRIRGRIEQVRQHEDTHFAGWEFDGGRVEANKADNRLQVFFDGKPDEAARDELKANGFRWAPSVGAWQRQLNKNAYYAAGCISCIQPISGEKPIDVQRSVQQQESAAPDAHLTGERVSTPRGSFHVADMTREQMETAGYGYHHSTDDGKYLIMGNGTQAFAIAAEQREQENYMRTAELSTEQNYNMIDGQINNTPSVDELEEKAKRGEVISLSALAAAVKAEDGRTPQRDPDGKKPSIRAQLKADRAQSCKPQQREKEQEAKRSIRQALEME